MKSKIYLALVFFNCMAFAQPLPQVTPPTPEAAAMAKFVESPVSYYTGTPDINYPIYTIESGGIEIPISLSYNAKGIQVAEIASKVGTGWVLNAGGVITRQVRTKVDEYPRGYMTKSYTSNFFTNASVRQSYLGDLDPDPDPDLYHFNFLGYSGKFIFDHVTKKPILQSYDDLKIEVVFASTNSYVVNEFIITDAKGIKYYFNVKDKLTGKVNYKFVNSSTGYVNLGNGSLNYNSAWYLKKIETPVMGAVTFYYNVENINYYSIDNLSTIDGGTVSYSKNSAYQNQISRIKFNNGIVEFRNDSIDRADLETGRSLKEVVIRDKDSIQVTKFKLNYTYTSALNDNSILGQLQTLDTISQNRLFLSSISRSYGTVNETTSFVYSDVVLPNRHSNKKDNWGYYNNASNSFIKVFLNADRNINSAYAEAGILKKIVYPTGGYTTYEYEQNTVLPPSFYEDMLVLTDIPKVNKLFMMLMDYKNDYNTTIGKYRRTFSVGGNKNTSGNVEVQFSHPDDEECEYNGVHNADCHYSIILTHLETGTPHRLTLGKYTIPLSPGTYSVEVDPMQGTHIYGAPPDNSPLWDQYLIQSFAIAIRYEEKTFDMLAPLPVGGKRIRRIKKWENDKILLEKEYLYTQNSKTSGKMHCLPPYFYIVENHGNAVGIVGETLLGFAPMSNFSGTEIGYGRVTEISKGEGDNGKTEYSFTNYPNAGEYYKAPFHVPIDLAWTRGRPLSIKHYKDTGAISKEILYKYKFFDSCINFGDQYHLAEPCDFPPFPTQFSYEPGPHTPPLPLPSQSANYIINQSKSVFPIIRAGTFVESWEDWSENNWDDGERFRLSFFIGGRGNLTETKEINYFDTGTISTTANFYHDSTLHNRLTSTTSTTSTSNEVKKTKYYYPKDIEMNGKPEVAQMRTNNMFVPLITQTFVNDEKLYEQETIFKDWDASTKILLAPEIVKSAKGTADPTNKIKYDKIDLTNGNVLQITMPNGIPVSYIWGYSKTQPVAKIEGLAYDAIPANLIGAVQNTTNTINNEANILTALNNLRNNAALVNAMVTTYTYKPSVGVTSVTDAKGYKITYHYDGFNRLKFVKDADGYILSENEYHYKTPN